MDLRKASGRERTHQPDELNITPIMNIFLILVPVMLLTAVFVRISIHEFSLPAGENAQQQDAPETKPVVTLLAITENGFQLKTQGKTFPDIPKESNDYDYAALVTALEQVRSVHAEAEDIILAPASSIKYEIIIRVMDRCRENGFLNISISA
jgi:biopolymer transport protein ExbD